VIGNFSHFVISVENFVICEICSLIRAGNLCVFYYALAAAARRAATMMFEKFGIIPRFFVPDYTTK
jgi:hypothetical protein